MLSACLLLIKAGAVAFVLMGMHEFWHGRATWWLPWFNDKCIMGTRWFTAERYYLPGWEWTPWVRIKMRKSRND